jgi:hypothetical protein
MDLGPGRPARVGRSRRVIHADPGVVMVLFQQSTARQLKLSKVQGDENGGKAGPQASVRKHQS